MMDGKSQAWRDAADKLLEALARQNKYIVGDMLIIFLESANYGLDDYTPLGGVFKRAAKRGIVTRVDRNTKQALWLSKVYGHNATDYPVEVYVRGVLVKAGNATISDEFNGEYTVTFENELAEFEKEIH